MRRVFLIVLVAGVVTSSPLWALRLLQTGMLRTENLVPYIEGYATARLPAFVTQALSERPNTYVVIVPAQTHNVLGFTECVIAIRNAWVEAPDAPPTDTSCLGTLKITFPSPS